MRLRVGYAGTTTKIKVVSSTNGALSATCTGGSVAISAWSERGADNPARAGVVPAYTATVTISGLSELTRYSYSVTEAGSDAISGSFITLTTDDTKDWSFFMSTCENFQQTLHGDYFTEMRKLCESTPETPLFYAHIDDLMYFDGHEISDTATGLVSTGKPDVTGLAWDYALAYLSWFGEIDTYNPPGGSETEIPTHTNFPNRQWIMRNLGFWAQWGDHEIEGDHCRLVFDGVSSDGCDRVLEATAEGEWDAFISDACTPPKLRAGEQYWGDTVGPVTFAAYDCNKHSQPYNACDAGDTHIYGRAGSAAAGTCSGATVPTRTTLGVGTDTAPTDFLGTQQVTDILTHLNDASPFKIIFASSAISRLNQPWAEQWPDEWDSFCNQATIGLMQNSKTNGTDGRTVFLKGDAHMREVNRYTSDGTSLGGVAGKTLWEINPGTINGSWIGANSQSLEQNGVRRYVKAGNGVQGDIIIGSFVHVIVRGSKSPKEIEYRMIDSSDGRLLWSGIQYSNQTDNEITVDFATLAAI